MIRPLVVAAVVVSVLWHTIAGCCAHHVHARGVEHEHGDGAAASGGVARATSSADAAVVAAACAAHGNEGQESAHGRASDPNGEAPVDEPAPCDEARCAPGLIDALRTGSGADNSAAPTPCWFDIAGPWAVSRPRDVAKGHADATPFSMGTLRRHAALSVRLI